MIKLKKIKQEEPRKEVSADASSDITNNRSSETDSSSSPSNMQTLLNNLIGQKRSSPLNAASFSDTKKVWLTLINIC